MLGTTDTPLAPGKLDARCGTVSRAPLRALAAGSGRGSTQLDDLILLSSAHRSLLRPGVALRSVSCSVPKLHAFRFGPPRLRQPCANCSCSAEDVSWSTATIR